MTGELILFEGKEVRVIEHNGEEWLPLYDLSIAWGLNRTTLFNLVKRNGELFEGCCLDLPGDYLSPDETKCINEEGLYLLLARVSTKRLKNRDSVIRFRKMAPKLIQKYRKKELVSAEPEQPLIKEELDRARLLAEATGGKLQEFQKIALKKCGYGDYAPALDANPVLVHGETGWYNPTRLVALCNDPDLTPERLNYFLMNKGFQTREGYLWRLTPLGAIHGREYNYEAPSGHKEIRIAWRESVLFASGLKRPVNETQLALPVRA